MSNNFIVIFRSQSQYIYKWDASQEQLLSVNVFEDPEFYVLFVAEIQVGAD